MNRKTNASGSTRNITRCDLSMVADISSVETICVTT